MRILFYLERFPGFGGIESVTAMLSSALADTGNQVFVCSLYGDEGTDQLSTINGKDEYVTLADCLDSGSEIERRLKALIQEKHIEVVVFQDSYARIEKFLFAVLASFCEKDRPKLITVEHNRPMLRVQPINGHGLIRLCRIIKRPLLIVRLFACEVDRRRRLYGKSDIYVLLSKYYYKRALRLKLYGDYRKFVALPNPVDMELVSPSWADKENAIVFVGSLIPRKGVDRLLSVWKVLEPAFPNWRFVIVGDGPLRECLEKKTKEEGLSHVDFEGRQSAPSLYFRKASIMVMASDFEGWPMVLGEGMANGCVPISTESFEAVHDIIDDGVNGFCVPHFDRDAFVGRLRMLMANPGELCRMQVAAHKKASRFSIASVVGEWNRFLQNTVYGGGR